MRLFRNALAAAALVTWGIFLKFRSWLGRNGPDLPTGDNVVRLSDHGDPFYISVQQQWVLNGLMVLPFLIFILAVWIDRRNR
ncbi:hypothetical protein [Brevundimonas subvibrioides]|uniref:hypothetical protein n=1 Tax=Brevundimonas subvibrioides TaxID=74313 RepID=UPI0022B3C5B9|nr:hypothetical protein [Brevundimonas subvibrioides]